MRVVDTNILIYAADADADDHEVCREFLSGLRNDSLPSYLTWNICYEFMRVSTHHRVFRRPWRSGQAWAFLQAVIAAPAFSMLMPTDRHGTVLAETLSELPRLRGNVLHDLDTAVVMREHGISQICTHDDDFSRFPFLTVLDPIG